MNELKYIGLIGLFVLMKYLGVPKEITQVYTYIVGIIALYDAVKWFHKLNARANTIIKGK